jgi:hypothetical protein
MRRSRMRRADEGSAPVEFLAGSVLLLVPLVYLVLTLATVQAAAFATEGAARAVAVLASRGGDAPSVAARIDRTVALALADFGVDSAGAAVTVDCSASGTCRPGDEVSVTVRVTVPLPFVPDGLPLALPVQGAATLAVARFPGAAP